MTGRFGLKAAAALFYLLTVFAPAGLPTGTALAANNLVNLPAHHWVYDALARLTRAGLISDGFLSIQPIRRDEAARLTAEALANRARLRREAPPESSSRFDWTDELLRRLEKEFREELQGETESPLFHGRAADTIEAETVFAGLNGRSKQPLENRGGRSVSEGLNGKVSWRGWVQSDEGLAVTLGLDASARDSDADLILNEGSLKLSRFGLDLEAGRDRQWWGPGEHGALILSDNAPPMDLIRIGNAHPSRLPFALRYLGDWKWAVFVARLEHDRDHPRAKLGGARLAWAPTGWLELGASRSVLFGGHGATHFGLQDFPQLLLGSGQDNQDPQARYVNNDNLAAWDVTVYLPFIRSVFPEIRGVKLYLEYGGEDNTWHEFLGVRYKGLMNIAQLMGMAISLPKADLQFEYANNVDDVSDWYVHWFYTSGYTFKGYTIGHEMGSDADDLSARATVYLSPEVRLVTLLERERAGFLDHPNHLKIIYAGQVGMGYSLLPDWEVSVEYRYEHVVHPEFAAGDEAAAHLLGARLEFHGIP
ncbi:MAG: hypothetical protein HY204_05030 [Nitrospirae bacterium]|nr:hypothetical protein [Nitrospirota bacterium]